MLTVFHSVSNLLHSVGVAAIFLVLFVECFGVPSPDEIILLFSGYLVSAHRFSYPVVIIAAVAGSTLGATGAYFLARLGGRRVMLKYFRFLFRTPERLEYWEQYFQRRGDIVVLIGRIISGVRAVISYPAGLFNMPYWRFLIYTVIGSLIWALLAVTVGVILGPHVVQALNATKHYELPVIVGLVVLAALWYWYDRRKKRRQESPSPE
ncbi:DedA family protein [Sulfobacillus harzensis]|uniref:DedA family protein n=1 Tax=Sulfobacillus harzensis TaxID=2729629 RepID=A0A7Y0L319_9FIRM|nr:DedA family protein [Sulfobacillus harzensis]NMP22394.1 DedA family protein [Sulfobacillus harzensis]